MSARADEPGTRPVVGARFTGKSGSPEKSSTQSRAQKVVHRKSSTESRPQKVVHRKSSTESRPQKVGETADVESGRAQQGHAQRTGRRNAPRSRVSATSRVPRPDRPGPGQRRRVLLPAPQGH